MRKQILKGFTMLLSVMALAMVTAVASANGQSLRAKASIPFDFIVGEKTLTAGAYTVSSLSAGGEALKISGIDSHNSVVRLSQQSEKTTERSMLVFYRYGQRYFLAEVWSAGEGRTVLASKEERAIQKEMSRIASNRSSNRGYETVEVALSAQQSGSRSSQKDASLPHMLASEQTKTATQRPRVAVLVFRSWVFGLRTLTVFS